MGSELSNIVKSNISDIRSVMALRDSDCLALKTFGSRAMGTFFFQ